jgi:hypothetical protein
MPSSYTRIRVPIALYVQLRRASVIRGKSVTEIIRESLELYLRRTSATGSAYDASLAGGLIGCVQGAPAKLSTGAKYFNKFGQR